MTEVPYEPHYDFLKGPKAPQGKYPFVRLEDGSLLNDSQRIIEHLIAARDLQIDAHLSPEQRAQGHLIRSLFEERLYFSLVYFRWLDDPGWGHIRTEYFRTVPPVLRSIVPWVARRGVRKQLWQQGVGRHSREEIVAMAARDVDAFAALLGDKPWALGELSSVDATTHAFLMALTTTPFDDPIKARVQGNDTLMAYVQRGRDAWWTDWSAPE